MRVSYCFPHLGDASPEASNHDEGMKGTGIATPIVLIVLLVVLSSLIAATSYMALGALKAP